MLNERIRELRTNVFEMNQREFAQALGISQTTLSGIEKGTRNLPGEAIPKLVNLSLENKNIDLVWLFTGKINTGCLNERESALLLMFRSLDERGKGAVENAAKYELDKAKYELNEEKV